MNHPPVMAVSMGDPAGIGPELCLRLLESAEIRAQCTPVVFGQADLLKRVAGVAGLPFTGRVMSADEWGRNPAPEGPTTVDGSSLDAASVEPGLVSAACGRFAAVCIENAVAAVQRGEAAALVTAPIHKEALRLGGVPFPGHTEMLASLTGARRVCMMLASEQMAVSLATVHVALADVPACLTREGILDALELTDAVFRRLRQRPPRIVVCALNPHAGEHGLFGGEDETVVAPAVAEARRRGILAEGPVPPDTAFLPERREQTDAYVAMYHDQGLIPFKMVSFESGVNVTLGLPIVRTSPDHGTAFDIAWQGKASAASFFEAVRWALRLAGRDSTALQH